MFREHRGRFQRDVESIQIQKNFTYTDMKCELVTPATKRMLKEKFQVAKSYLGRFIGNILKHFTNKRDVQAVRDDLMTLCSFETWTLCSFA
jgi:hypothetical protein